MLITDEIFNHWRNGTQNGHSVKLIKGTTLLSVVIEKTLYFNWQT